MTARKTRIFLWLLVVILFVLSGCSGESVSTPQISQDGLKVTFLDVGQADSILIQNGQDSMLIDAGNNGDTNKVVGYIKNQGIKKLEYVVGTHPHEDHIGGMDGVIRTFAVGKIIMPKVSHNTKTYEDVLNAIKDKGLKITPPVPGTEYHLGDASFTILAPNSKSYKELNNYSVVLKMTYGKNSFLFEGDAEALSEQEILDKGFDVSADVVKLGHHGSSSSSLPAYIKKVHPAYAVISVGKGNDYGHPHRKTMDLLKQEGIPVFRTDENGTIIAVSDGKTITFNAKPGSYDWP